VILIGFDYFGDPGSPERSVEKNSRALETVLISMVAGFYLNIEKI
jgi:hypothetical protein